MKENFLIAQSAWKVWKKRKHLKIWGTHFCDPHAVKYVSTLPDPPSWESLLVFEHCSLRRSMMAVVLSHQTSLKGSSKPIYTLRSPLSWVPLFPYPLICFFFSSANVIAANRCLIFKYFCFPMTPSFQGPSGVLIAPHSLSSFCLTGLFIFFLASHGPLIGCI